MEGTKEIPIKALSEVNKCAMPMFSVPPKDPEWQK